MAGEVTWLCELFLLWINGLKLFFLSVFRPPRNPWWKPPWPWQRHQSTKSPQPVERMRPAQRASQLVTRCDSAINGGIFWWLDWRQRNGRYLDGYLHIIGTRMGPKSKISHPEILWCAVWKMWLWKNLSNTCWRLWSNTPWVVVSKRVVRAHSPQIKCIFGGKVITEFALKFLPGHSFGSLWHLILRSFAWRCFPSVFGHNKSTATTNKLENNWVLHANQPKQPRTPKSLEFSLGNSWQVSSVRNPGWLFYIYI